LLSRQPTRFRDRVPAVRNVAIRNSANYSSGIARDATKTAAAAAAAAALAVYFAEQVANSAARTLRPAPMLLRASAALS
jgi:hypothetical protein